MSSIASAPTARRDDRVGHVGGMGGSALQLFLTASSVAASAVRSRVTTNPFVSVREGWRGRIASSRGDFRAGLVDEIGIHLVPVLFGSGLRRFDRVGEEHIGLDNIERVQTRVATHLRYRVAKRPS